MVWSSPSGEVLIDIVTRPGQSEHGHAGGAGYGKPAGVQPRAPPSPYAQPYQPPLRLHNPGYGSAALSYRDGSYGRGEYRGGGGGGGRVSLLGGAYLPPPAPPLHHPPPADPPPFKKIRLSAERPAAHHPQLRVDTREPVYNIVEVLSPNPPSEPTLEDHNFRTTKDDLLQQISKVDREMALSEATLQNLKKKAAELELAATRPSRPAEPEEAPSRHRSLAQCIYADNRKKASAAHASLAHLGPSLSYPLYNQPQDTEVYHENLRKHRTFRKRLSEHIRRIKLETEKKEDALAEEYSRRAAEWMRRVERIEQSQKRKAKDARNREFFEKVFPELRKQREERERFNRLGARVKSEAELEEIADGLHEQEHEDKKMRSLTVVPPLMREPGTPTVLTNMRCMDMETEHKELQLRNVWSPAERDLFREKYLQHPKNFGQIASFLPRKTVKDCVRFYYLSKKAKNYKQLLRKPRQRRSTRNPPRTAPEPEMPSGVLTRLQRSQGTSARATDSKEACVEEMTPEQLNMIPVPPQPEPLHMDQLGHEGELQLQDMQDMHMHTLHAPMLQDMQCSDPSIMGEQMNMQGINMQNMQGMHMQNLQSIQSPPSPHSIQLLQPTHPARPEMNRTPPLPPSPPPASSAPSAPPQLFTSTSTATSTAASTSTSSSTSTSTCTSTSTSVSTITSTCTSTSAVSTVTITVTPVGDTPASSPAPVTSGVTTSTTSSSGTDAASPKSDSQVVVEMSLASVPLPTVAPASTPSTFTATVTSVGVITTSCSSTASCPTAVTCPTAACPITSAGSSAPPTPQPAQPPTPTQPPPTPEPGQYYIHLAGYRMINSKEVFLSGDGMPKKGFFRTFFLVLTRLCFCNL
ncbi:nuclear receptor corepressor 1 isoform X2 [Papilio machaon]|uniref:nuclear receptor corepressor 1 isoform X2 n=1 Tax=Papilio machaon TaxID=76193 RepID=UPI001E663B2E|nr:nuclear receptor corepressor 1 isoform X2 [Papilio machaon]